MSLNQMPNAQEQFKCLYARMLVAIQEGNEILADEFRVKMELVRQNHISKRRNRSCEPERFSDFVKSVLNKNQQELGISYRSNCINAAFNFHFEEPVFIPYSTMDFLGIIQEQFFQIPLSSELRWGDLIVFWSRNGDQWKDRNIAVENLKPGRPGFPFGLVFDHVAVFVGNNQLFHKPDPTLSSCYQINDWDDVVGFNEGLPGFELTFHRKNLVGG